ncbi:MAG: CoA transferase [Acidimicrobiia bacterium]|jgi:crotonobetainyl-CoA:carnitine CoA-transferase CaiB-like acyl-CoA transferase
MGVLDGIKVVELAEHGFVPSCAAILGDWGADVVKVERPTGDPLRAIMGAGFVTDTGDINFLWELINRNKRGIALDLRVPEGRTAFDKLIEQADVFVTNFLPSARTKLRTNPEDLWAVNPRLVYAKGHGQGQKGPDADAGGFDAVSYWGRGGIGHILTPADGPMIMQRGAMGDAPSGAMLAGGIAAALFNRERTGKGMVVDVSLLNFAVWQLGVDLTATTITREEPAKMSNDTARSNPLVGPHKTADGRWLLLNMIDDTRHWVPACRALGLDDLVDDPRCVDTATRAQHAQELHDRIREAIGSRTLADLHARLQAEDTISSALASPLEVIDDPQVIANGYLAKHPSHPTLRMACAPMQFDDEQITVRRGAPGIGEHTDEVLTEAGFSADEIATLRSVGAAGAAE